MLTCIANFPKERDVYLRDRHDGRYGSNAFLCTTAYLCHVHFTLLLRSGAYMCIELPCTLVSALLSSTLLCFVVGLSVL